MAPKSINKLFSRNQKHLFGINMYILQISLYFVGGIHTLEKSTANEVSDKFGINSSNSSSDSNTLAINLNSRMLTQKQQLQRKNYLSSVVLTTQPTKKKQFHHQRFKAKRIHMPSHGTNFVKTQGCPSSQSPYVILCNSQQQKIPMVNSNNSKTSNYSSNSNFNSTSNFNFKNNNIFFTKINEQSTTLKIKTSLTRGKGSPTNHYYNSSNTLHSDGERIVIRENTDIVVYRNVHESASGPVHVSCSSKARTTPPYIIRPIGWECICNPVGSISLVCEKRSGQCSCLSNVEGRRCDKCRPGYWNLTATTGCIDCNCDRIGSKSNECNPRTGQCECKMGISGQKCDQCQEDFYSFTNDGCTRCEVCPGEGQICDAFNGRCTCPLNSRGLGCSQCILGTWDWQEKIGCKECDCGKVGSIGKTCHPVSGQCTCREGYKGRKCEDCAVGYFGYPECRRCNCDSDGSFMRADGLIACDVNGQCSCKALVIGLKCDTCRQGTFGLSRLNPEGCTRCFCFGRTNECTQSEWSWGHIRTHSARNLSVQYLHPSAVPNSEFEYIFNIQMEGSKLYREDTEINMINNLNLIPKSTGNISMGAYTKFFYPLYFQLAPQFLGDRTSSYGGNIVFTLLTEGGNTSLDKEVLDQFPIVQIHSHTKLSINFFEFEEKIFSKNVTFTIPLRESYWKLHHNGQEVDRPTIMAVLQNIKHIFLRGTVTKDFEQVIILNTQMDSAIYVQGSTNMIAKGVERCNCPKMYQGLSCQDPGPGYYRWKNATVNQNVYIEDLIGRAVPCNCNGRSNLCDSESGLCLNCQANTGGVHCEHCAEGFYGDPNSGKCQSCPCPERSRNFAKGCTLWNGEVNCICKPGYAGPLCDQCSPGYFGSPHADNGICKPCDCNLNGIALEECDEKTGQCNCRQGVTGRSCNVCILERHYLEDQNCKLCDNCTLLLMDYEDLINQKLRRDVTYTKLTNISAPWVKLNECEAKRLDISSQVQSLIDTRRMLLNYEEYELQKLNSYAENQKFLTRKSNLESAKRSKVVANLRKETAVMYYYIESVCFDILDTIFILNNYGSSDHYMSLPTALRKARSYLNLIQQYDKTVQDTRNTWNMAWKWYYFYGNASDTAFDLKARVNIFWGHLNHTNFRFSEARLFTDKTFEMLNEIGDIHEHIINIKSYLVEDYGQVRELNEEIGQYSNQSLIPKGNMCLNMFKGKHKELDNELESVKSLSTLLNLTLEEYDKVRKEVFKHWLPKARKHVEKLTERSHDYMRQFQPARNGAKFALLARYTRKDIEQTDKIYKKSLTKN